MVSGDQESLLVKTTAYGGGLKFVFIPAIPRVSTGELRLLAAASQDWRGMRTTVEYLLAAA